MMQDWRTIAEGVPAQAVGVMAIQLSEHGCDVEFRDGRGTVSSIAGQVAFRLEAGRFDVKILQNPGHFPEKMLWGGIRQLVEEAIERVKRVEA